jgi:hypothetical protein
MLTPESVGLVHLDTWSDAYRAPNARKRLDAIRSIAPQFKRDFVRQRPAIAVRTLDVSKAPYPVTYAFNRACTLPYPYLLFQNRALVVQFEQRGATKTLLLNPTIPDRSARAPFFADLARTMPFSRFVQHRFLESPPVHVQLERIGLRADEIDYVAFDHQHVQDLRPYLGTRDTPKLYPNAKYLVQRHDWDASVDLHPLQRPWFVADSAQRVNTDSLVLLDGDYGLGDGVALIATPGHTYGNQSLLFRAPDSGTYTVSENGICMDAYAPAASRIPGLASHARRSGDEVVLNANTLENALDQYNSMVKEKLLADPFPRDPRFVQHFSSSELIASVLAPGLRATHEIRAVNEGSIRQSRPS